MHHIAERSASTILVVSNGAIAVDHAGRRYNNLHTGELLMDLASRGYEPTYLAPKTDYDANSNLYDFDLAAHGIASLVWDVRNRATALLSLPDVLGHVWRAKHVYIFFPGTLGTIIALFCRFFGKPYGLYVRGSQFRSGRLSLATLRSAAFILTVSPSLENELRAYCSDVATIRPMLGITIADRAERGESTGARTKWRLLFVGRLETDKGIRELIAAARLLAARGFPYELKLVGGGPLHQQLQDDMAAGSVPQNVQLLGLISDKTTLMREYEWADLFVFPSYHEGFPRALYEAMIKSLPIITTMVGGIAGRMQDGVNCVAIPAKDADAIASAIERLVADAPLLFKIGRGGLETVMEVMSTLREHAELLEERLQGRV